MKKLICNIVIFLFVFVSCSQEDIEMMDKVDNQKDENLFVQVDSINSKSNLRSVSLEFANATVKKYAIGYSMKFNPSPFTAPFILFLMGVSLVHLKVLFQVLIILSM